ncbi:MAG: ATP-binding protein, partial [Candidatus Aminicenantes bacterium]|nr:ATP-binding protein [Candidatus Aminicenantes bacterium]
WRMAARDRDVVEMETGSLRPAVEEAVLRFSRMTPPAETGLTVEIQTALPVRHDRRAIGEIVLNLLINAYKYTGQDKRIRLSAGDENGRVAITVRDNGIGMSQSALKKIFDPFYRVDTVLRSKAPGAGLGLAIVRHLVKMHGGEIFVESEPGRGSLFTIHLPAAREEGLAR